MYRGISEYDTANCVQFTNYSYIITLGVSMYLDIRISGSLITSQGSTYHYYLIMIGLYLEILFWGRSVKSCMQTAHSFSSPPSPLDRTSVMMFRMYMSALIESFRVLLLIVLDCGMANITAPELGQLSVESTLFGSVASYTCESDYILVGDEERTCSLNGWSGTQPECCK